MRLPLLLAALAAALLPAPTLAWGKTGHRVVAAIADRHLTPAARRAVRRTLGVESLAEASNWPDFMRSDPAPFWQDESTPWHYVTVPTGKTYAEVGAPPEGDAMTALIRYSKLVRDRRAPLAERQLALRFIVHIVGDLHQPLHVGRPGDRGGNDVKVTWFGEPTNLHSVWDTKLVDEQQLSYSEMTAWLDARITPGMVRRWSVVDANVWIAESAALRERIYPAADKTALSYGYVYENKARVEERLEQGGIRLAAYLNKLFPAPKPRRRR
jgi:hypothetical protein